MTHLKSRSLILLAAGFATWAAAFIILYGTFSVGCVSGWQSLQAGSFELQRAILLGLYIFGMVTTITIAYRLSRHRFEAERESRPIDFVVSVASYAAIAAIPATAFTFSGLTFLSTCR